MATVSKKELIERVADQTNQTWVVTKEVVQAFLDNIIVELGRGNRLEFRDFGVFEVRQRGARNPDPSDRSPRRLLDPPPRPCYSVLS